MRIELNPGTAVSEGKLEKGTGSRSAAAADGESSAEFSAGKASVSTLAAAALASPEQRAAKVESLRNQVSAGTYQVAAQQVAGSILEQIRRAS